MSKSQFAVTYKGERHDIPQPGTKSLVLLERQFGIGAQSIQEAPRFEHMVFMAYVALKGKGVAVGKYDDAFLDDIEMVAGEDDEAADADEDPTGETPPQQ